ncbi:MAG: outer-membrane lipoprotein carrier protein LolA [Mariprofundaceae bacterium]|nr:outer-membrane lipoprotein carrier protein LolA [Mariprofundaceae bacterium]
MRQIILIMGLLLPCMAIAAPLPAELARTLNQLGRARGFSGQFEQTIRFSDGTMQRYRGEVDVLTPGHFRWRYTEPYEQLFVSDGHTIWHYEPDLMQVQILKTMQGVDPAVIRLLDGSLDMHDVVLLETGNKADGTTHRYHVRIGEKKKVWLGLAGGHLAYVESVDTLGNRNRIILQNVVFHPPPRAKFTFHIPPGVDVLPLQ